LAPPAIQHSTFNIQHFVHSFLPHRSLLLPSHAADLFKLRVNHLAGEENERGEFVLYWSQSSRRLRNNLGLEHAIRLANERGLPVLVYESIRPDYPNANDRIHAFVLEGVAANARDAAARGIGYHFFLPRTAGEARGVVRTLAQRARIVVTDDYPTFVVRDHVRRFAPQSPVALHVVDGNGLLPMRAFAKEQYSAKFLRDRAHRMFEEFWSRLVESEAKKPFKGSIDLPRYDGSDPRAAAASCEIDHSVWPVKIVGGRDVALQRLESFIRHGLRGYATERNRAVVHTSGLSPYLHFGHIGIHEIAERVLLSGAPDEDIDSFLEEAVIRRELSFNFCFYREDHDSLASLPDWAKKTLDAHRDDRRKPSYGYDELEAAATYDDVWNLSQRQLRETGIIHGYLRMLWGKKIIEWSETPEEAHATMIRLHERWAIDGRDPNTHAGVMWCFGKHDRPWAPQRPVFGMIRYMSSDSTRKKVRLKEIEATLDPAPSLF
jgi:deoxyribodipyrimidine photo-lyase